MGGRVKANSATFEIIGNKGSLLGEVIIMLVNMLERVLNEPRTPTGSSSS